MSYENYEKNIEYLKSTGIPFIVRDSAVLFRNEGKPVVDFYPGTGNWKVGVRMFREGSVKKFIEWYNKTTDKDYPREGTFDFSSESQKFMSKIKPFLKENIDNKELFSVVRDTISTTYLKGKHKNYAEFQNNKSLK